MKGSADVTSRAYIKILMGRSDSEDLELKIKEQLSANLKVTFPDSTSVSTVNQQIILDDPSAVSTSAVRLMSALACLSLMIISV